jgi:hypothetical protein
MSGSRKDNKSHTASEAKSPEIPTTRPNIQDPKIIALMKSRMVVTGSTQPPSKIIPVKQQENFFKDLYAAITALAPAYKKLHKDKLFTRRSGDLMKLSQMANDVHDEVLQDIQRRSHPHNEAEIIQCYARGIAKLLFSLRQHLTERIDGDSTLVHRLNQIEKQHDHHALRLVGLLFRNAFLSMASVSAVAENERIHANYLAKNVLGKLSDEHVRDNPYYRDVLGKFPVTLSVKPITSAKMIIAVPSVTPIQNYSHQNEKGKPSRANRHATFSKHSGEGVDMQNETEQNLENKKTPKPD